MSASIETRRFLSRSDNRIQFIDPTTTVTIMKTAETKAGDYSKSIHRRGGTWARNACAIDAHNAMWTALLCVVLLGLASCCVSLPQVQYVNDKPYHLKQFMECKGGKDMEINQVQDIDECKSVCVYRRCKALNLFQLGEFEFKCEILRYVDDIVPAQGAACYVTYFN